MNDFLTIAYLNIDGFKYPSDMNAINPKDLDEHKQGNRKFVIYSFLFITTGFVFSKYSKNILKFIKNKVFQIETPEITEIKEHFVVTDTIIDSTRQSFEKTKPIKQSTSFENIFSNKNTLMKKDYMENIFTKKKNLNLDIIEGDKDNDSKVLAYMKPAKSRLLNKNEILMNEKNKEYFNFTTKNSKGNQMTSRFFKISLIWFPVFTFIGIFALKTLYTNLSLYLKYQPLVDAYYNTELEKEKKIKEKI